MLALGAASSAKRPKNIKMRICYLRQTTSQRDEPFLEAIDFLAKDKEH